MKKLLISSVMLVGALSAGAAPLFTIGDQMDIFFKGAVLGDWNNNILHAQASDKKWDDYKVTIRLGAEMDYGRNSKFKMNIKFYEDLIRYLSHDEFNVNLANVFWNASYTETFFTLDTHFSFRQLRQNSATVGQGLADIVRRDAYNARIMGSYQFSEKLFGEIGGTWYGERFQTYKHLYSDQDVWAIPVNLLYRVTPKISVGLSYQVRYSEFSGGRYTSDNGRLDNFGGVTLRGEIAPKLSAVIYAGVIHRNMYVSGSSDEFNFSFSALLNYELSQKINLYAKGYRDFSNGASRQSSVSSGCDIGVNYAITPFVNARGSFGYQNSDYSYSSRNDDEISLTAGISYSPVRYLSMGLTYRYLNNDSNVYSYMSHNVGFDVSVRY